MHEGGGNGWRKRAAVIAHLRHAFQLSRVVEGPSLQSAEHCTTLCKHRATRHRRMPRIAEDCTPLHNKIATQGCPTGNTAEMSQSTKSATGNDGRARSSLCSMRYNMRHTNSQRHGWSLPTNLQRAVVLLLLLSIPLTSPTAVSCRCCCCCCGCCCCCCCCCGTPARASPPEARPSARPSAPANSSRCGRTRRAARAPVGGVIRACLRAALRPITSQSVPVCTWLCCARGLAAPSAGPCSSFALS